jgi:hypothetical protein
MAVHQEAEKERCRDLNDRGLAVTEPTQTAIPSDEGEVQIFERVFWRTGNSTATEGKFAITERSALLVTPPGTAGVRISFEVVSEIALSPVNPHSMEITSCWGRVDIFNFWQPDLSNFDPKAAAAAAAKIKARVAVSHAAADKSHEAPR